jgi:hypothetical protein
MDHRYPYVGVTFSQRETHYATPAQPAPPLTLSRRTAMYQKPELTKHEDLRQVTFSSH